MIGPPHRWNRPMFPDRTFRLSIHTHVSVQVSWAEGLVLFSVFSKGAIEYLISTLHRSLVDNQRSHRGSMPSRAKKKKLVAWPLRNFIIGRIAPDGEQACKTRRPWTWAMRSHARKKKGSQSRKSGRAILNVLLGNVRQSPLPPPLRIPNAALNGKGAENISGQRLNRGKNRICEDRLLYFQPRSSMYLSRSPSPRPSHPSITPIPPSQLPISPSRQSSQQTVSCDPKKSGSRASTPLAVSFLTTHL